MAVVLSLCSVEAGYLNFSKGREIDMRGIDSDAGMIEIILGLFICHRA